MYIKSRALASLITLAALFGIVQAPPFSRAAGERKLEVFSWWTSGGEAAALDALFNTYKKQYPGVEIINATVAVAEALQLAQCSRPVWRAVIRLIPGKVILPGRC